MSVRPRFAERTLAETAQMMIDYNITVHQQFAALYPDFQPVWDFLYKKNSYAPRGFDGFNGGVNARSKTTNQVFTLAMLQATDQRPRTAEEDGYHTDFINNL